ncbi:MAG: YncE family protein [Nitrososphaeraceae archaeon]|nr:YncE family protein [Nitrososphaeraceae archaeon]
MIFKNSSTLPSKIFLLKLSFFLVSLSGVLNAYGISHDKLEKFSEFSDSLPSEGKLNKKIKENSSSSFSDNSKIQNGETENGFLKPLPSELTVVTQVNNEGGGKKNPSDFTIQVEGNNPNPSSFPGDSEGTIVKLEQGKYSVSESTSSDYTVSKSSSCSGTINPGQTKTCTITYDYSTPVITGTLKVVKKVVNDGGGSRGPSDFTITVNGKAPQPSSFPGSSTGVNVNLKKGAYSVTETGPSEYNADYSSGCLGNMSPGQKITCTITNVFQPKDQSAQLIVIKDVVNSYNDNDSVVKLKSSAFTIKVNGNDPSPKSFPGRSGSGITVTLDPGRYSVTEKGPLGYSATYSNGCDGNIKSGQAKVCIITNEVNIVQPVITPQSQLSVIGTISGFSSPYGLAFNSNNNLLYVTNSAILNKPGSILVINTTNNSFDSIIPAGNNPNAIIYNSANDLIFVTNSNSDVISIINTTTNLLSDSINIGNFLGTGLSGIAINPFNNTIYATNSGTNTVIIINGTSNIITDIISQMTGKFFSPSGIAYNYDNGNLYVTNRGLDTVSVINSTTKALVDVISTGGIAPSSIIYNPVNNYLYVVNTGSDTVAIVNGTTNKVVETVSTGHRPIGITYNEYDGDIYITNSINGTVSVIDGFLNTVIDTINVSNNDNNLTGIEFNSNNDNIYVSNTATGSIFILG